MTKNFWSGKKILLTGHTGFKGSWLSLWLLKMGANVTGLALHPEKSPNLFDYLNLSGSVDHRIHDIRDATYVHSVIEEVNPDVVFHLAAQPLVRRSYSQPYSTWETNVMGTINVLEALRHIDKPCAAVMITTDKCYENREWIYGYRENDPLGGADTYSSSKAGAEIAIASWRQSFFQRHPVGISSARAGNVIGGGDWSEDRIVPDTIRFLEKKEKILIRAPNSTRPWQHVLEPLNGYIQLAERLYNSSNSTGGENIYATSYNFGPALDSNRSVAELVDTILKFWPGEWLDISDSLAVHEASKLNLVTDKAFHQLNWKPRWDFETTVRETVNWYQSIHDTNAVDLCLSQIKKYTSSF